MGKPTLNERAEKLGLELSKCGGTRLVTDHDTNKLYRYALTPKGYAVNNDQSAGFYTLSEVAKALEHKEEMADPLRHY
jgi:hypothetical protein